MNVIQEFEVRRCLVKPLHRHSVPNLLYIVCVSKLNQSNVELLWQDKIRRVGAFLHQFHKMLRVSIKASYASSSANEGTWEECLVEDGSKESIDLHIEQIK